MEASEELAAGLYDFLYKDEKRLASWSAQIFTGRLTGIEQLSSTTATVSSDARVGAPNVVGVSTSDVRQENKTRRDMFDPHDLRIVDVLSFLQDQGLLNQDVAAAPHGSLVLGQGELIFLDATMLGVLKEFASQAVREARTAKKTPESAATTQLLQLVSSMLSSLQFPSAFFMHTIDGRQVVGTVHEDGMQEPISTYCFKHGSSSLPDTFCIGVKEVANLNHSIEISDVFQGIQSAAAEASKLLFASDSIRVTPLAIFRKIY